MTTRVLSGVQSSGRLHWGNYFGAIKQHIALQDEKDAERFYFIADFHALTTVQDAVKMRALVHERTLFALRTISGCARAAACAAAWGQFDRAPSPARDDLAGPAQSGIASGDCGFPLPCESYSPLRSWDVRLPMATMYPCARCSRGHRPDPCRSTTVGSMAKGN